MEQVLRSSDSGILVYVAPTKALVKCVQSSRPEAELTRLHSQVAAEIYARFSKEIPGANLWAVHTRDYRIHNPQKCQILVTVCVAHPASRARR